MPNIGQRQPLGHVRIIDGPELIWRVTNVTLFGAFVGVIEPLHQAILMDIFDGASALTRMN